MESPKREGRKTCRKSIFSPPLIKSGEGKKKISEGRRANTRREV